MNKIGLYSSYWTKDWEVIYSSFVKMVSNLGYDIFEINPARILTAGKNEKDQLKQVAEENNIILTYCTALSKENDISSENAEVRAEGVKFLKENLKLISEMGGSSLAGVIYGAWNQMLDGPITEKTAYLNRSIESMREVIKLAEDLNVTCNVEVLNRYEQFMLNTCEEAVEYVRSVDSPMMKIHLDTYHMNIEEDRFDEAIVTAGKLLGHFHVCENNRRLPGKGHIPWIEIFQALRKINYTGNIVVEPFIQHEGTVAQSVKLWRDIKKDEDLYIEARKCREFLDTHVNKYLKK